MQTRRQVLGSVSYAANTTSIFELLFAPWAVGQLILRLTGTLTPSSGSYPGALCDNTPMTLIKGISIEAQGSGFSGRLKSSIPFAHLWRRARLNYGVTGERTPVVATASTPTNFVATAPLEFWLDRMPLRQALSTLLNPKMFQKLNLLIEWGDYTNLIANAVSNHDVTYTLTNVRLDVVAVYDVETALNGVFYINRETRDIISAATTNTDLRQKLNVGQYVKSLTILSREAPAYSAGQGNPANFIKNLAVKLNGNVHSEWRDADDSGFSQLLEENLRAYQLSSVLTGEAVIDFIQRGGGGMDSALNLKKTQPNQFELAYNMTGAASRLIEVITQEIIRP